MFLELGICDADATAHRFWYLMVCICWCGRVIYLFSIVIVALNSLGNVSFSM